jgi:hypothetical protein
MRRGIERRLARIKASIPVPMTAERFLAEANRLAGRLGDVGSAMAKITQHLSDAELESLAEEFGEIAFGSDTAARDAVKRKALAAAGCQDLDKINLQGTEEYAW